MTFTTIGFRRGAMALAGAAALAALAACGEDAVDITLPKVQDELFRTYVSMGNSITAGYQSGGINDSTQAQSYAVLLAAQMGTSFQYQKLRRPGCPAPTTSFGGARVGGAAAPQCSLLLPQALSTVNNVAWPGALIIDATNNATSSSNITTELLAGGKSQVTRMLEASPTFVSAWLGNNDVLGAATTGINVPTANVGGTGVASPGITAVATFQSRYQLVVDSLKLAPRLKGGVLIGVVDVTNVPYLFPGAALANPTNKAIFDAVVGRATTVINCPSTTPALIGVQIIAALRANPALVVSCSKITGQAVAGDLFIVDSTERVALTAAVTGYNTFIQQKAAELGFAYFDPNPTLVAEKAAGNVTPFAPATIAQAAPAAAQGQPSFPFGIDFSYDGVHPSARAHRVIANEIIKVINAKYGTSLAAVSVQ